MTLDEAREAGLDAFELVADFPKSAEGLRDRGQDRATSRSSSIAATRELVGAAMACPDASAAIHECVLAIKARVPVDVLAETIHAFPSTSRIFNGLFADALTRAGRAAGSVVQPRARPRTTTSPSTRTIGGRAVDSGPPGSTGSSSEPPG